MAKGRLVLHAAQPSVQKRAYQAQIIGAASNRTNLTCTSGHGRKGSSPTPPPRSQDASASLHKHASSAAVRATVFTCAPHDTTDSSVAPAAFQHRLSYAD
jgi:hypothetical protein